jgi:predicted phosphohydrolase
MSESEAVGRSELSRRAFVRQGSLSLFGAAMALNPAADAPAEEAADAEPKIRIGLATDLHYADKAAEGTRYYRESPTKFSEAARQFRADKVDLVVELGDLIDGADAPEVEKERLRRLVGQFKALPGQHHFVLGNHCVHSLSKAEFLETAGQKKSYYSFDLGGYHFVVLDACFRGDGTPYGRKNFQWTDAAISAAEADWLRSDLKQTPHKTTVFVHQRLDVEPPYGVKNAAEIRKILEQSGKVMAVFQGHYHPGDYKQIAGIHYGTLSAMIEGSGEKNSAYAVMDILPGDAIRVRGFRRQRGYTW